MEGAGRERQREKGERRKVRSGKERGRREWSGKGEESR